MKIELLGVLLLTATGWGQAASRMDRVKIDTGELQGAQRGAVIAFKGVPFAAPPTGANRWRPPQPAASWKGVRRATEYAADCAQLPFPSDAAPLGTQPSENCLYANVWTPAKRASANLPVMIWIYGGGFVNGGSSPSVYDGTQFAEQGLVFVSFNYRLGRFGFFAHPALTKAAGGSSEPLGNYGYMDQIAALQWVKRNAAAFGGDPDNITIFGESAGGGSVVMLMTSPLSRGMFQRAIVESGGGRVLLPMKTLSESEACGVAFAKQAGITGDDQAALDKLRALPAEQVVNHLNMASMFAQQQIYCGPMLDGKLVTETPEQAFLAGHEMKIPLMAGANSADIGFSTATSMHQLFAPFGDNREKAMAAYNPSNSTDLRAIGMLVAADRMMIEPARFMVREITAAGQPAYEYRFSYVAESMRKQWTGAPHATEIPFVFNTVAAKYENALTKADEGIARAANAYWAAFARTGNPNQSGYPEWPAYQPGSDVLMNFTAAGPVAEKDPWKDRLDLTEALSGKSTP